MRGGQQILVTSFLWVDVMKQDNARIMFPHSHVVIQVKMIPYAESKNLRTTHQGVKKIRFTSRLFVCVSRVFIAGPATANDGPRFLPEVAQRSRLLQA